MKKKLCLYTVEYPFGKGEQFIENEITFLANSFETVYIFPLKKKGNKRSIPHNVKIAEITELNDYRAKQSVKYLGFWSVYYFKETLKLYSLINAISLTLKKAYQNFKLYYFLSKNNLVKNTIHYSYWFSDWATHLAILKSKHKIQNFISRAHGYDLYSEDYEPYYIPYRKFQLKYINFLFLISKLGLN